MLLLIDKIQSRYSWTDEQLQKVYYARFFDIVDTIILAERNEFREKMFFTWQLLSPNLDGKSFKDYLTDFGLTVENHIEKKEDNRKESEKILEKLDEAIKKKKGKKK